jgi:NAD(P)-dependent dehydrogenase (short-subunit alcohol dehydrogenase family)
MQDRQQAGLSVPFVLAYQGHGRLAKQQAGNRDRCRSRHRACGCPVAGVAGVGPAQDSAVTELAAERVPGAVPFVVDLAAPGSGARIVAAAQEALGGLDIVVHAAGILAPRESLPSRQALEHVARVDMFGAMELLDAAVPVMQAQVAGGSVPGAIVTLVSAEAVYGDPEMWAEAASKAALLSLTRSLSHRLAGSGIGCNAVIPMAGTRQVDATLVYSEQRQAHHRLMKPLAPSLVANLIAWLCTPLAAGINGQLFMARGREILLFSQARPANSFFQSQLLEPEELAQSIKEIRRDLTDDWTAIDAFGNDPVP